MAAVLACGPRAVLSHRAAAAHLGLGRDNRPRVEVTVPRRSGRSRYGIDVHVSTTLAPADVTLYDGIPCTSVPRTLVDLGDIVDRRQVERAVEQAEILRVFDLAAVERALERAGPRRGAGVLRDVIGEEVGLGRTASELEERFLQICADAALPRPAVNECIAVDGEELKPDFLWRQARLVVETDGRKTHGTRAAFERDRQRDQVLEVAGYTVVRFSWRQVVREPGRVARTVGALLGR
jgi:hypothetical protein